MKLFFKQIGKKYPITLLSLITAFGFSLLILSANYINYPVNGIKDIIFILLHWTASFFGIFLITLVLNVSKYSFTLFPIFFTVSGIIAYFTWQYDVSINSALIESLRYTNFGEVRNYLTLPLVLIILAAFTVGLYPVIQRFKIKLTRRDIILTLAFASLSLLVFYTVNRVKFNTLIVRSPFSIYFATKQYIEEKKEIKTNRFMLGENATIKSDTITVVFVIGEALRADHVQMNGYNRTTMPRIEELGAISLPNVFSPYTHTAQSLTYILTRADSLNLQPMFEESSFIDIYKSLSFKTIWIGNQNPVKTFSFIMNECDSIIINKPQLSDYSNQKKLDSDLIPYFNRFTNGSQAKKLAIVHLAGNHWWYNKNFPDTFALFQPILENKIISPSNREKMINSYDNATLFTDYVLSEFIGTLSKKNALLIFLADHGQSFGEEGKWLHANNTDAEKNPACFIWLSEAYKEKYPDRSKTLELNKNSFINSSFLFHTILDGSDIKSPYIISSQSVFSDDFQQEKGNTDLKAE